MYEINITSNNKFRLTPAIGINNLTNRSAYACFILTPCADFKNPAKLCKNSAVSSNSSLGYIYSNIKNFFFF